MFPDEGNLTERQFWAILARRVSREMQKHPTCKQHRLWCDGLLGERYFLDSEPRRITGVAWIDSGRHQEEWKFSVILPLCIRRSRHNMVRTSAGVRGGRLVRDRP